MRIVENQYSKKNVKVEFLKWRFSFYLEYHQKIIFLTSNTSKIFIKT